MELRAHSKLIGDAHVGADARSKLLVHVADVDVDDDPASTSSCSGLRSYDAASSSSEADVDRGLVTVAVLRGAVLVEYRRDVAAKRQGGCSIAVGGRSRSRAVA
jgi:hypothetical protein